MKPGRYAAEDGSFARSAGGAGARGLGLLALALLIGIVLLNATDGEPPGSSVQATGTGAAHSSANPAKSNDKTPGTTTTAPTTTLPARAPKDVKVIVANASSVKGAAGNAKAALDPAGFNVLAPANATTVAESSVYFTPGYDRDAAAIAATLGLPATVVKPMPAPAPLDVKGANVAVVLGTDQASKFAAPPAKSTASTTTTAASAATTTTKR